MFKSSSAHHAPRTLSRQTRSSELAGPPSEAVRPYQALLAQTCQRFPEAWSSALRNALSNCFDSGDAQILDLSALPRGCLFAAKDVIEAFLQVCNELDRRPLALCLPPALRRLPDWVNDCDMLRSIQLPKFAGRHLDFSRLPHLHRLTLTGIPENARHALSLHLQKGCAVDGQLANGRKAEWRSTNDAQATHESLTLMASAWDNPNGQVAWNETHAWAAEGNRFVIQEAGLTGAAKIFCRQIALAVTQAWASARTKGQALVWRNSPSAIAREVHPELEACFDRLCARPANAVPVALDEWPRFLDKSFRTMKSQGEQCRCALLITANHALPLMLDRSGPRPRLICADPNLEQQTRLRKPFRIEQLLHPEEPRLYLNKSPNQVLLAPEAPSAQRQTLSMPSDGQAGHVLVIWLPDPLDLDSATVADPRDAKIDSSHLGQTPTPGLLHELVRLGAKAAALSKSLSKAMAVCRGQGEPALSFLELFASFSEPIEGYQGHDPLLATAFKCQQWHLLKPLGDVLLNAREQLALSDEDVFVCLTAAGGASPSPLSFVLNSTAPQALPAFSELLLRLWEHAALSSDTLQAVLRDGIGRNNNGHWSDEAIQRFDTLLNSLVEAGALTDEQASSLRALLETRPRLKVKRRF